MNSLLEIAMFGFEPSLNQSQSIGGESVGSSQRLQVNMQTPYGLYEVALP
jgi:hypothetical protein